MRSCSTLLLAIALGALAACTSVSGSRSTNSDVGEWMPITDDLRKGQILAKYGIPAKNQVFEGMVFWREHPFVTVPPTVFRWHDQSFTIWLQKGESLELDKYSVDIDSCAGLRSSLDALLLAVVDTARIMIEVKQDPHPNRFVVSPIAYDLKYFPPVGGSITLNNFQKDEVPWIEKAEHVVSVSTTCVRG